MFISEFLPNPIGKDIDGEWIELFNNSQEVINLAGWGIKDASGKTFILKNQQIGPSEYLVLDYKTTKISLNNNGETIFLYNSQGSLVDKAGFSGTAPEGKSLMRQNNPEGKQASYGAGQFVFTGQPTPGKTNIFEGPEANQEANSENQLTAIISDGSARPAENYKSQINFSNLFIGIILAMVLAFLFVIIFKKFDLGKD